MHEWLGCARPTSNLIPGTVAPLWRSERQLYLYPGHLVEARASGSCTSL